MEEVGEVLQRADGARVEGGAQAAVGVFAVGGSDPVFAGVELTCEEAPGVVGVGPGPLFGAQHGVDDAHAGIEVLAQQVGVDGQGAGRAVVGADQRVRVRTGVHHHMQAELVRQVHGVGALEENRVDIAAQQADQLVVAAAEAAGAQAHLRAIDVLLLLVAVGAAVGVVH